MNDTALRATWKRLRASYWFIPAVMCAFAFGLSFLMPFVDQVVDGDRTNVPSWIYGGGVQGARALLSTIAGSMITVASLTFSITLVALSAAAQQYGPRLLTHFMRDAGYQVVLGTFVATFLYSVLVLRQIQDVEGAVVLPRLAVTFAVALAIAALALLIYFIHHAATSLRPDVLVQRIGADLRAAIRRDISRSERTRSLEQRPKEEDSIPRTRAVLVSPHTGHVEHLDEARLVSLAASQHLEVRTLRKAGDFVTRGAELVEIEALNGVNEQMSQEALEAFIFGSTSFSQGDAESAISQLVEVAVRAVSPSLNNPGTAIACIDELQNALVMMAEAKGHAADAGSRPAGSEGGRSRVHILRSDLADLVGLAFDEIRHYSRGQPSVIVRLMQALVVLSSQAHDDDSLQALSQQAELTLQSGADLPEARDRRALARLQRLVAADVASKRGRVRISNE